MCKLVSVSLPFEGDSHDHACAESWLPLGGLPEGVWPPQDDLLIVNLAVITASVDRCHFEIDSRIIGLDLLKELMLIEDALPNGRVHYNMAVGLRVAANAVQGAYDEDPGEWCESTWRNYGPDGVTKKGWITRRGAP